jgi:hypothetical protein
VDFNRRMIDSDNLCFALHIGNISWLHPEERCCLRRRRKNRSENHWETTRMSTSDRLPL